MKKLAILMTGLFLAVTPLFSQDVFSGQITYDIEVTGDQAEMMAGMMPEAYIFTLDGDGRAKFKIEGGMVAAMFGEFYIDGNTGDSYMVKHSEQVAYDMSGGDDASESSKENDADVEKLNETATIAGYKTQKYKVTSTNEKGEKTVTYVWIAEDLSIGKLKDAENLEGGAESFFVEGVNGFPLKIESEIPQMGGNMIMKASSVEKKKYKKSDFEVPAGYEVKEFDPSSMMGF